MYIYIKWNSQIHRPFQLYTRIWKKWFLTSRRGDRISQLFFIAMRTSTWYRSIAYTKGCCCISTCITGSCFLVLSTRTQCETKTAIEGENHQLSMCTAFWQLERLGNTTITYTATVLRLCVYRSNKENSNGAGRWIFATIVPSVLIHHRTYQTPHKTKQTAK